MKPFFSFLLCEEFQNTLLKDPYFCCDGLKYLISTTVYML